MPFYFRSSFLLQELRIQEMSEDVPVGRIPRSITAQIKGDLTRILRFSFASLWINGSHHFLFLAVLVMLSISVEFSYRAQILNLRWWYSISFENSYFLSQSSGVGHISSTFIDVMSIKQNKKRYTDLDIMPDTFRDLQKYRKEDEFYPKLAQSIAPEIYGHQDIKKALLLLLCGGVSRNLPDGVRVRGDMHICLMGDPGVAKSQLLKHIVKVAPR